MKKEEVDAAKQGLLLGLGMALKALPHPLLKGAAILAAIAAHMELSLRVQPEKEVKGPVRRKPKLPKESAE